MIRLSETTLRQLPADIEVPAYDRRAVSVGIVHLGIGAFHRAHQAVLTDDRLGVGETEWAIAAASLRSQDTNAALGPQDDLYTLSVRDGEGERLRVVGSIVRTIFAPADPEALLGALADPRVRIVTLTVTEKGYTANIAERSLLRDHPDVVHDLANPSRPRSVLGYLAEAIDRRRAAGVAPFTLLSCDNLPSNGRTLHRVLTEFASLRSAEFGAFVAANVACPSSMVDRIVPATTNEDRRRVTERLGVEDAWPVMAEPFLQWVIEDHFPTGRPRWEEAGAEIVRDVAPFERMKLRMLNGSHTAIAAIGQVAGLETVADAFGHPVVRRFVRAYWNEVGPTLDPVVDWRAYAARLVERFDNPALRHRTVQIASDASQKVPQRILEPLRELRAARRPSGALVFALAAWFRSCAAADEAGRPLAVNDSVYRAWARPGSADAPDGALVVERFLAFDAVFDPAWRTDAGLVAELTAALRDIRDLGVIAAIGKRFPPIAAGEKA